VEVDDMKRGTEDTLLEVRTYQLEEALHLALDDYVTALDEEWGYDVPLEELRDEILPMIEGWIMGMR
jgi:uncharacterized protein YihD (DUF1040 family)